jgi:hypothetical protein
MRIGLTASVFLGQQNGVHRAIMHGDDVEPVSSGCAVTTQQAGAVFQRVLVRLLVLVAEFFAPICTQQPRTRTDAGNAFLKISQLRMPYI